MAELTEIHELQIAVEGLRRHLSIFSIEALAEIERMQAEIGRLIAAVQKQEKKP